MTLLELFDTILYLSLALIPLVAIGTLLYAILTMNTQEKP